MVKAIYEILGIKKCTSTPYHPQTDGLCERYNQILKNIIRKMCNAHKGEWDYFLPFALASYRWSIQTSIQESPYFAMIGQDPCLPVDFLRDPEVEMILLASVTPNFRVPLQSNTMSLPTIKKEDHTCDKKSNASTTGAQEQTRE